MTHKQWFNNVLHLHPVHEEGAQLSYPITYQKVRQNNWHGKYEETHENDRRFFIRE